MIVGDPVSPTHLCALGLVQVTLLRPDRFKALIDEDKGVEDVAARFGVSVLTVQRRLKLSALSPKLLALNRQDGINLDQLHRDKKLGIEEERSADADEATADAWARINLEQQDIEARR